MKCHQEPHLAVGLVHEPHRLHGVRNLVGERTVAPVALGVTESEVVEAEHSDALAGQLLADPARSGAVLAQCEAMGEHSPAADRAFGEVDETSQAGPARAGEPHPFGHVTHPPRQESHVFASGDLTGRRLRRAQELLINP
jgi:hypothetical protein